MRTTRREWLKRSTRFIASVPVMSSIGAATAHAIGEEGAEGTLVTSEVSLPDVKYTFDLQRAWCLETYSAERLRNELQFTYRLPDSGDWCELEVRKISSGLALTTGLRVGDRYLGRDGKRLQLYKLDDLAQRTVDLVTQVNNFTIHVQRKSKRIDYRIVLH